MHSVDDFILHGIVSAQVLKFHGGSVSMQSADDCVTHDDHR